jgi:hypothetical protein
MGSHVSGCEAANRLIETVIAPNFSRFQSLRLIPAMETGVTDHVLSVEEVVTSQSMLPRTLLVLCKTSAA